MSANCIRKCGLLGSYWGPIGAFWGGFRSPIRALVASLPGPTRVRLGSCWSPIGGPVGVRLGSSYWGSDWGLAGALLGPYCDRTGVVLGPIGVLLGSYCGPLGTPPIGALPGPLTFATGCVPGYYLGVPPETWGRSLGADDHRHGLVSGRAGG